MFNDAIDIYYFWAMNFIEEIGRFEQILSEPLFRAATEVADEMGIEAYLIGGYVRDVLLGRTCNDVDIVVAGNGADYAKNLAKHLGLTKGVKVFKNFGTAHFVYNNYVVELVGARKESYRSNSRKPVVEDGSIEDDQNRRDFTINALAVKLNNPGRGMMSDPFHGLDDLNLHLIRTPLDPDITYSDDPLRMMRAIRFACQLLFDIHPASLLSIRRNSKRLSIVSPERIMEELNKIILSPKPSTGFCLMFETGLLEIIFPQFVALKGVAYVEGKGHKDNFTHTLEVLDKLSVNTDNLWLRWAAILHDIGKPGVKRFDSQAGWTFHGHEIKGARMVPAIFNKLHLPLNEKMRYVQKLVQLHLRPIVLAEDIVTDSAVRRLLFEAGDEIDDLMQLCEADITTKNPVKANIYLANFKIVRQKLIEIEEKDRIRNWQPPVSGELIMSTFNIGPSETVGIIKNEIREAILDGLIPNDFEAAFELMITVGEKIGLKKREV